MVFSKVIFIKENLAWNTIKTKKLAKTQKHLFTPSFENQPTFIHQHHTRPDYTTPTYPPTPHHPSTQTTTHNLHPHLPIPQEHWSKKVHQEG